jgi:hypothetical protein
VDPSGVVHPDAFPDCLRAGGGGVKELDDAPIATGSIDDAEEGIRVFEAFREGPGRNITL